MTRQVFYLKQWDWFVTVFYEAGPDNYDEIVDALIDAGCKDDKLQDAKTEINKGLPNYGLTFTGYKRKMSVVVIGKTTSADEFQNSYDHEKGHLVKHICQALHISPWGEEAEYLAGAIGQKSFVYAKNFLCEHCRKHRMS